MINFRVMCLPHEVDSIVNELSKIYEVVEVSPFYKNRGASKLGRVYITVTRRK